MIYFYNYLGVSLTFHAPAHTRSGRAFRSYSSLYFLFAKYLPNDKYQHHGYSALWGIRCNR